MPACHRYIELNPVRAGIVASPGDYLWSSHRANAQGEADDLLAPHPVYFGLSDTALARQQQYRGLFDGALDPTLVDEIRSATRNGRTLGTERKPRGRPSKENPGQTPFFYGSEK